MTKRIIFLALNLFVVLLFVGCSDSDMKIYTIDDFESIVEQESTFKDVYKVAPSNQLIITSFGAVGEYPTSDGRYIRIKYSGEELIVTSIEVVDNKW